MLLAGDQEDERESSCSSSSWEQQFTAGVGHFFLGSHLADKFAKRKEKHLRSSYTSLKSLILENDNATSSSSEFSILSTTPTLEQDREEQKGRGKGNQRDRYFRSSSSRHKLPQDHILWPWPVFQVACLATKSQSVILID